ncbi:hypothetical protein D7X48_15885 [bacterium D16-50]|nr:hypothetical protein D7X48_15885 [bacterium D16-50]
MKAEGVDLLGTAVGHMKEKDFMGMDREWIQRETENFHVFYREADRDFAGALIERIEAFYQDICRRAYLEPEEDGYDLYVCGTVEEFLRGTGYAKEYYQDWMVGNADSVRRRLCILAPRGKGDLSQEYQEYLIKVMLHEVTHIVFNRICPGNRCGLWLSEGTAVCLAGQLDPEHASDRDYPRLADLAGETDPVAFADKGGYTYGGIYVRYLMELLGMERFLSVYRGECRLEELLENSFESRAIAFCKELQVRG